MYPTGGQIDRLDNAARGARRDCGKSARGVFEHNHRRAGFGCQDTAAPQPPGRSGAGTDRTGGAPAARQPRARRSQAQRHSRRVRHRFGGHAQFRVSAIDFCQRQSCPDDRGADDDCCSRRRKQCGLGATAVQPSVSVGALNALGLGVSTSGGGSGGINSATVVANGMVQTQVAVSNATLQAMVNAGLATVVGGASNSGISSTIVNGANNQLIQQMTTVDIGISGLSKLLQQNVTSSLVNRLNGPNTFR